MSEPLGYLLTWTCYGAWLHGDERGAVDADHNTPGTEFLPPDETRLRHEVRTMSHRPVTLSVSARRVVTDTVKAHCEFRSWTLHAANARTNHVHAVMSCNVHPKAAMKQLKSWTTRRLRERGLMPPDTPVWTEGGSRRWLWSAEDLRRAIEYVDDYQGDDPR
jgi:REP element-mobilizing transposase RayT